MPRTLLLLAAALLAAVALLAGPKPCHGAGPLAAERKIEQQLESPTQLEFIETPLQDVVDYLKDFHAIEIQIDRNACDDVGLDPSTTPITKNIKGISLRSALNLTLRDHDLTYLIHDEVLLITTVKDAARRMTTKVYPVDDLGGGVKKPHEGPTPCQMLIHVITTIVAPQSWGPGPTAVYPGRGGYMMGGLGGPGGFPGGEYDGAAPPRKKPAPDPKGSIADASFAGRPMLVVSQTYHVHCQIAALLTELRSVAGSKPPTPATAPKKTGTTSTPKPGAKKTAAPRPPQPPAAAPAADPFSGEPAAEPPAGPAAEPPGDPFADQPADESSAKGSASDSDDPFSR
ncbi:MAG: hypothetical protein ACYSWU_17310 [Planctomycetota bacterium]|jgi:hypothetical protein